MAVLFGVLAMLALAAGGLALIVRSGESIGKSRRDWKEMNNQRDFYKANPGATQADYVQHYIRRRNQELNSPQGSVRQQQSGPPTAPTPARWTQPFPSPPSRIRLEGWFPGLVLRWDASQSTIPMDYYRVWFLDASGLHIDFVDVDATECALPLGDLLDPAIPERFVEVSGIDVDGQTSQTSRRLSVKT